MDRVHVSFLEPERWIPPGELKAASRTSGTAYAATAVLLGDNEVGPAVLLLSVPPGITPPDAPAHGHASDNFRISLRGALPMGSEVYRQGEFRLQRGWKPYRSDNYAHGPDGGWTFLLFADRRGMKVRHVSKDSPSHEVQDRKLAEWLGIKGDLISDDPQDTSGPSTLVTDLGPLKANHFNGSFAESHRWPQAGPQTRAAGALMGDPVCGPVLVMATTTANGQSAPERTFDTEVLHLIVGGSCTVGDYVYVSGDLMVVPAGVRSAPVIAGPDGVQELIVLGDRRGVVPDAGEHSWLGEVNRLLTDLLEESRRLAQV
ncbi:hypothetical protein [Cryptosporangium sp. NPDC051539]|uniref:hypothetical protein n=1 Tax=Cryptosporangium sp. NPDC051539 TaxID=3363962 RepID=UPI00379E4F69